VPAKREKAFETRAYEESMTLAIAPFPPSAPLPTSHAARYRLESVSDDALHAGVKTLAGRYNAVTADLLAHLAEVDARGIYRERACSSLYTYCVYELRLSEDEAQRRARAARAARTFPVLFEMLAEGAIHLTGLLLLAPHLTAENHAELLARARFRTKREIEQLVARIAPRPDVPARIEPLGPRPQAVRNLWQAFTASLRGPVRELVAGVEKGQAPPAVFDDEASAPEQVEPLSAGVDDDASAPERVEPLSAGVDDGASASERLSAAVDDGSSAPERIAAPTAFAGWEPLAPFRYRVEFTASQQYVDLLEEARNLLQHQVPNRDVARVHELAMAAFVEHLRKRRQAARDRPRRAGGFDGRKQRRGCRGAAPARLAEGRDGSAPERVTRADDESAPERVKPQRGRLVGGTSRKARGPDVAQGRHVPAGIRRAVWQRDEGRCTFADASGRRCRERAGLELHHEHAFALGGPTTLENLRLLCRAHNALFAERDFGQERIERMKSGR
jgi:hypothetical protein